MSDGTRFFWRKAVFWIPLVRSGTHFASGAGKGVTDQSNWWRSIKASFRCYRQCETFIVLVMSSEYFCKCWKFWRYAQRYRQLQAFFVCCLINLLYVVDNLQVNYKMFPLLFPVCMLARHVVMVCKYMYCGGLFGRDSNSHPILGNYLGELYFFSVFLIPFP